MKQNDSTKYRLLFYPAFIIITFVTIYPLFFTGIGCGDDIHDYITALKGDFRDNADLLAHISGRFYFVFMTPVHNLPYIWDNMVIIKLFQLVPLLACLFLFTLIVYRFTKSREISLLFSLLFLSLTQISGHTSLFLTYPFYFTFSFSLLLLSFLFLAIYLEKGKRKYLTGSVILFAAGLLFYEVYLLYIPFAAALIIIDGIRKGSTAREKYLKPLLHLLPYVIVVICYLVAYVVYRQYHPSLYDGTKFDTAGTTALSFFRVLWGLSYSAIPTNVYESSKEFFIEHTELAGGFSPVVLDIILTAHPEWLIKAALVAICAFILLNRTEKISFSTFIIGLISGLFLIFIPHLPLAFSVKYRFYVENGMIGYVTTFYSIFGVMFVLTMLTALIMRFVSFNKIVRIIVSLALVTVLFAVSVITDFSNYMIAKNVKATNIPFGIVDELMKSDRFANVVPEGSYIYMPDLYYDHSFAAPNLMAQDFNWGYYIVEKYHREYHSVKTADEFRMAAADTGRMILYLIKRQAKNSESAYVAIGQLDKKSYSDSLRPPSQIFTNHLIFIYYSPVKTFSFSFRTADSLTSKPYPFMINHIHDTIPAGHEIKFNIFKTETKAKATIFTIEGKQIDMKSFRISDIICPEDKYIYLY